MPIPVAVEHEDSHLKHSHDEHEDHGHGDIEPAVVKKQSPSEKLADQMEKSGVSCEALPLGSHQFENQPYYSHMFALSSRVATNKGIVKIKGRNVDFVQVLQGV